MVVSLIISALVIGSVYGLIALGYSLIYSASGLMTFTQGELLMLGAYLGLTFYKFLGFPFIVALILTLIIMFVFGLMIERFLIRVLLNKKASPIYVVLSTIALSIVLMNMAQQIWGSLTLQFPSIFSVVTVDVLGSAIQPESFLVMIVGLISMVTMHIFMTKMKFGTSMRAAAMNPLAASCVGINVGRTTGITWAMAAALAGLAGILLGPVQGVSLGMGTMIGLKGFAAAVIGGYGNMYGAILGGLIIGFCETFTAAYITSSYKDFIVFFLLILVMIFMPRGIFTAKVYDR